MKLTISELQAFETKIVHEIAEICKRNNIDYFLHCGSALGAIRHNGPIPWDVDVDIIVPYNQYIIMINTLRDQLSEKFYIDYYDFNKNCLALFARVGLKGYSTEILHIDIFKLVGISSDIHQQHKFTKKARLYRNLYLPQKVKVDYFGRNTFRHIVIAALKKLILYPISTKKIIEKFERLCEMYPFDNAEYVTNPSGHYGVRNIMPKSYYGKGRYVNYEGIEVRIPENYDSYLRHYYGDYMQLPPENKRYVNDFYYIIEL